MHISSIDACFQPPIPSMTFNKTSNPRELRSKRFTMRFQMCMSSWIWLRPCIKKRSKINPKKQGNRIIIFMMYIYIYTHLHMYTNTLVFVDISLALESFEWVWLLLSSNLWFKGCVTKGLFHKNEVQGVRMGNYHLKWPINVNPGLINPYSDY